MRIFNADGSEAEMCGNGIRCVAKYAYEHKLAKDKGEFAVPGQAPLPASMDIETGNGILRVGLAGPAKIKEWKKSALIWASRFWKLRRFR